MARASTGTFRVTAACPAGRAFRDEGKALLEELGVQVRRRSVTGDDVRLSGVRGSSWVAILAQFVPLLPLFGLGSRVRVDVLLRTSLNPGDESQRLSVRCSPIRELDDDAEWTGITNDFGEAVGDHLQARRCFRIVVDALARKGYLERR